MKRKFLPFIVALVALGTLCATAKIKVVLPGVPKNSMDKNVGAVDIDELIDGSRVSQLPWTLYVDAKVEYHPGAAKYADYLDQGERVIESEAFNRFTCVVTAGDQNEEMVKEKLPAGARLKIVRYSVDEPDGVNLVVSEESDGTKTYKDLLETLGANGYVNNSVDVPVGGVVDFSYQMILEKPDGNGGVEETTSNIAKPNVVKTYSNSVKVLRSGTPDAGTCPDKEVYRNAIAFMSETVGEGCGYRLYRDGVKVAELADNGDGTFSLVEGGGVEFFEDVVVFTDYVEADPIMEGENMSGGYADVTPWFYAIAHYDNRGNSYGNAESGVEFEGTTDELVLNTKANTETVAYSCAEIMAVTTLEWGQSFYDPNIEDLDTEADVNAIRYDIYRQIGNGGFEYVASTTDDFYTDACKYRRETVTSSAPSDEELLPINYYVKAIISENPTKPSDTPKNSNVASASYDVQGRIITGVESAEAEGPAIAVANGKITVTGAEGEIEVYNINGALVAKAKGNGGVTEIDATSLGAGAYVVKTINNNSAKILIK